MIPIIALIGRTNVGKSTLFNILTKTKNALVSNHKNLTRDRQYGICKIQNKQKILLIDTGGLNIDLKLQTIEKQTYQQTLIAIKESDLILFVVDAHTGLMSQDFQISEMIRKKQKKTILIINKMDGIKDTSSINEFYELGIKEIQKISASHNQGLDDLYSKYLIPWIKIEWKNKENTKKLINKKSTIKTDKIKIACVGRPNVGKSTLINGLLKTERMITCNIPGTTLDSISTPINYNGKDYILIDTAGAPSKKNKKHSKIEDFSIIKTLQSIQKSNIVLLIIDANIRICHQDLSLADFIIDSGKGIVIVINKWDLLKYEQKENIKNQIKDKFRFVFFAKIHFISALHQRGIFEILKSASELYETSKKKITTATLTKTMYIAVKKHQPPMLKGRRIKLKYAHLGSSNPLKIIIHGNQVQFLSTSYKRYLKNFFYYTLDIKGMPIQIEFKDSINPYIKHKKTTNIQ